MRAAKALRGGDSVRRPGPTPAPREDCAGLWVWRPGVPNCFASRRSLWRLWARPGWGGQNTGLVRAGGADRGPDAPGRLAQSVRPGWPHGVGDHPESQRWGPSFSSKVFSFSCLESSWNKSCELFPEEPASWACNLILDENPEVRGPGAGCTPRAALPERSWASPVRGAGRRTEGGQPPKARLQSALGTADPWCAPPLLYSSCLPRLAGPRTLLYPSSSGESTPVTVTATERTLPEAAGRGHGSRSWAAWAPTPAPLCAAGCPWLASVPGSLLYPPGGSAWVFRHVERHPEQDGP